MNELWFKWNGHICSLVTISLDSIILRATSYCLIIGSNFIYVHDRGNYVYHIRASSIQLVRTIASWTSYITLSIFLSLFLFLSFYLPICLIWTFLLFLIALSFSHILSLSFSNDHSFSVQLSFSYISHIYFNYIFLKWNLSFFLISVSFTLTISLSNETSFFLIGILSISLFLSLKWCISLDRHFFTFQFSGELVRSVRMTCTKFGRATVTFDRRDENPFSKWPQYWPPYLPHSDTFPDGCPRVFRGRFKPA